MAQRERRSKMTTTETLWRTRYYEDMSLIAIALGLDPHAIPEDEGANRVLDAIERVTFDRNQAEIERDRFQEVAGTFRRKFADADVHIEQVEARINAVRDVLDRAHDRVENVTASDVRRALGDAR